MTTIDTATFVRCAMAFLAVGDPRSGGDSMYLLILVPQQYYFCQRIVCRHVRRWRRFLAAAVRRARLLPRTLFCRRVTVALASY